MTEPDPTILIVEDDPATRTFLADNLTADGYDALLAETARDGQRMLEYRHPDLVVLDLMLPDEPGLALLERLRASDGLASRMDPGVPVLVLTGRDSELDRVRGFQRGADDYLVKPFSYPELLERLGALLRRARPRSALGHVRVGELEIDPSSREVRLRGRRVELAQKEFALLRALAAQPTRVFTKEELLRDVWGFRSMGSTRTLDSHACRLRQKLAGRGDRFVVNVWGVGYRLVDGPVAEPAAAA
jgi:DNA-binding response OmpR family regulator